MISSELKPLQQSVLHYLSTPGHPERLLMLRDLDVEGQMTTTSTTAFVLHVRDYVARNPRSFCEAGINRFLKEFPDFKKVDPKAKITVTYELEVTGFNPRLFASGSDRADQGIVLDIQTHIRDFVSRQTNIAVTKAKWTDYKVETI